jgi:hypothetical protein
MQASTKGQIGALAFGVALEKAQNGAPPMSKAEFDGLCETVFMELERAVEAVLTGKATPTPKPKRTPRKAAEPASGGAKRSGIAEDMLRAFIGTAHSEARTLQEIADRFDVSKGVALRAVKALSGHRVATGERTAGQPGKAPAVFWVE